MRASVVSQKSQVASATLNRLALIMRVSGTLLTTLVVALQATSGIEAGYKRLNEYLSKKVPSDEISPNMEAANRWLEEQACSKCSLLRMAPVADLRKFTALQQVIGDTECDYTTYTIMRENEKAIGLLKLKLNGEVSRRVDRVMLDIFNSHAKKCLKVYPAAYRARRPHVSKQVLKRVEIIARAIMEADSHEILPSRLWSNWIKHDPSVRYFQPEHIHAALMANAVDDPNQRFARESSKDQLGKAVINRDKIRGLVKEHLLEPCWNYMADFSDIFIPAKFDSRVHFALDNSSVDYYWAWAYFTICQELTAESAVVEYLVKLAVERP